MATATGGRGASGEACCQQPEHKLEVVSGTVVHIIAEQLAIELGHAHGDPRYEQMNPLCYEPGLADLIFFIIIYDYMMTLNVCYLFVRCVSSSWYSLLLRRGECQGCSILVCLSVLVCTCVYGMLYVIGKCKNCCGMLNLCRYLCLNLNCIFLWHMGTV